VCVCVCMCVYGPTSWELLYYSSFQSVGQ